MAGITIHIDEDHSTKLLPHPVKLYQLDAIQRKLRQFVNDQDFQQTVDQEILRLYEAKTQPPVCAHAVIWTDGSCLGNPGPGG